jgi:mono/diheme cytochrome c family protein
MLQCQKTALTSRRIYSRRIGRVALASMLAATACHTHSDTSDTSDTSAAAPALNAADDKTPKKNAAEKTSDRDLPIRVESDSSLANAESRTIDLRELERSGALAKYKKTEVHVQDDPAYHKPMRYLGIPLLQILKDHLPVESIDWRGHRIQFVAADGYKTSISWDDLQTDQAYLATEDLDAKDGRWSMIRRGKDTVTPAPFYLVWRDVDYDPEHQAWPYQLTTIEPVSLEALYGAAFPKHDRNQEEGFRLFQIHCAGCHSVNLIGGSVGPELNVPKNVSEYWRPETLRPFVRHARAFRARTTMPDFRKLTEAEIDTILNYVVAMKDAKTCSNLTVCDTLLSAP